VAGQRAAIEPALEQHDAGVGVPRVVLDQDAIVGRVTLTNIVLGPFQSCNLGYWVSSTHNGRGLATAGVADIMPLAFADRRLHRGRAEKRLCGGACRLRFDSGVKE
jgi:[ribosomal protein S5]-alanine N-acetyltransferase